MGLTLTKVHEYARIEGTQEWRLVKTRPYLRLCAGGGPPLFVQEGRIYAEGGEEVGAYSDTPLPPWFLDEAGKVSPEVRAEVGLKLPEEGREVTPKSPENVGAGLRTGPVVSPGRKTGRVQSPPPTSEGLATSWPCPECQAEVPLKVKGLHIARHNRANRVPVRAANRVRRAG